MRKAIKINLAEADRQALTAIVTDRNSPQKHVWRAQIVLLTADGCGTMDLTRRTGTSKTSVWRWQDRSRRGRGRPAARQDPPLAHSTAFAGGAGQRGRCYANRASWRDNALDVGRDGQARWHQRQF